MPLFAYLFPLATLDLDEYAHLEGFITKSALQLRDWINFEMPDLVVSFGGILLVAYFLGFMVAALRLVDRLWEIGLFLKMEKNRPNYALGWQGDATACFSQLILHWDKLGEEGKKNWASTWLPIHPLFAWEAFLVELLLVINWWNPLMLWWGRQWQSIYHFKLSQRPQKPVNPVFLLKISGLCGVAGLVALFFSFLPSHTSPTYWFAGKTARLAKHVVFSYQKEKTRPAEYTFQWGGMVVPLKKIAQPNGYAGNIDLQLADFQKIINEEMKIMRDTQALETGILSIIYQTKAGGHHAYINDIDRKRVRLLDRRNDRVYNDSLGHGDELTIFGEIGDIYLSKLLIRILDPNSVYEPLVQVPDINHLDPSFGFQIVARPDKKALVKVDSTSFDSRRILEMYRDSSRYEIVHIPGFQTNRRYLTAADALFKKGTFAEVELAHTSPDVDYMPEYQGYQNKKVSLRWGGMEAAPTSPNFPLDSFRLSSKQPIQLWIGEKQLPIESFECIIAGKNVTPYGFKSDRFDHPALLFAYEGIGAETSVYFDQIVIQDEDGQLKLFPAAFVFNVAER
jgi:hypothetical protein